MSLFLVVTTEGTAMIPAGMPVLHPEITAEMSFESPKLLVRWIPDDQPNLRAQRMVAAVTDHHVIFGGNVLFADLDAATLAALLAVE